VIVAADEPHPASATASAERPKATEPGGGPERSHELSSREDSFVGDVLPVGGDRAEEQLEFAHLRVQDVVR
jgi:hypothetical protein